METLAGKAKYGLLRWGDDAAGNRHVWPAFDEAHDPMAYQLGLDRLHYSGDGAWETGAPIPPSAAPK